MTKKSSSEAPTGLQLYLSHPWNVIQTGFMLLTWIVMSIHIELIGPTMPTIAANVGVAFSGMGSVLASRGAGYLVATIFGAILPNIVKKHSEALLACAFVLPAIAVFATPFISSLILLCILFFIQGIGHGLTDLGGNNVMLTMWGANAAAPLNTVQLGYGLGAVIVNLLVRPFLTKTVSTIDSTEAPNTATETRAKLFIPYTVTAVCCALVALGHVFFYIRGLKTVKETLEVHEADYAAVSTNPETEIPSTKKSDSSPYSPRTCGRGYFQYGLILSILFISSIFFILGNDTTFSKFFFTFLKFDRFNISTGAASWAVISYWLSYSVGRLIAAIASVYVPVNTCLNVVWFAGLCLAITWLVFVWVIGLSATSLFVLGAVTGLVFAPFIPLTMAFFNQRLNVVPFLLALVLCGSALGIMIFPKLGGLVMDTNPNHFPTLLFICIIMSILLYVISNVLYAIHQRKTTKNVRSTIVNNTELNFEPVNNEEQEMVEYLKEQQDT